MERCKNLYGKCIESWGRGGGGCGCPLWIITTFSFCANNTLTRGRLHLGCSVPAALWAALPDGGSLCLLYAGKRLAQYCRRGIRWAPRNVSSLNDRAPWWMVTSRAGHFRYFFNNKIWFFCTFYQVSNLFLHQSYIKKPTPSQINLIKNAKNNFYCWKNSKIPKVPSSGLASWKTVPSVVNVS